MLFKSYAVVTTAQVCSLFIAQGAGCQADHNGLRLLVMVRYLPLLHEFRLTLEHLQAGDMKLGHVRLVRCGPRSSD